METDGYVGPVLDNHLHLNGTSGKGLEAVSEFAAAGGTHLIILNRPVHGYVESVDGPADFEVGFDRTCELVTAARDRLPGTAWAVLGVHPTTISRLVEEGMDPAAAAEVMCAGLDRAAEYVRQGEAIGVKSGRPHYEVADPVAEATTSVLEHAFQIAGEVGCPVQLHTEGGDSFPGIVSLAAAGGVSPEQVVKHYADGPLEALTPSVTAKKAALKRAVEAGEPFLMETDYLDDPDRPGAVLGPKTVPRRSRWLAEAGHTAALRRAHVETPAMVYGIDTEETLQAPPRQNSSSED